MGAPRKYSDEQRAEALALYVSDGLGAASRMTEIPRGTISCWACETPGTQTLAIENRERLKKAMDANDLRWQGQKVELVKKFAAMAVTMLSVADDNVESGNVRNVKDALTSAAIAVDKAQLLSGGATGRIEHSDADGELAAEVARRVEELRTVAPGTVSLDARRTA